jgi:hypothetical protein
MAQVKSGKVALNLEDDWPADDIVFLFSLATTTVETVL